MSTQKILIVDDEKLILISTRIVLESVGYGVVTAASGEEAIGKAREESPGLILLDIMMPGIDGWETLSRLKEDAETKDIPVIIFTAREHSRGRLRCPGASQASSSRWMSATTRFCSTTWLPSGRLMRHAPRSYQSMTPRISSPSRRRKTSGVWASAWRR